MVAPDEHPRSDTLIVLGLSEPTVTMVLDNLESCGQFPRIRIINNLGRSNVKPFDNPAFQIEVVTTDEGVASGAPAVLGVNLPPSKHAVFARFEGRGFSFRTIVHRASAISSTASLGHGVNINSLVSVAAFARLGHFVSVNRNASVGHHSELADFVTVNPGANIAGFVRVGRRTLIGMGANIMDGLEIGADTVIGAGSLVTNDIPSGVVAYGNPCRVVRTNEAQSL